MDAVEPQRLGRFWEAALGCERLTDEPDVVETRADRRGRPGARPVLPARPGAAGRAGRACTSTSQAGPVRPRWSSGFACPSAHRPLDIGQGDVPWVVLADREGNACWVLAKPGLRTPAAGRSPRSRSSFADPARDADFWSWLTGWTDDHGAHPGHCATPRGSVPCSSCSRSSAPKGTQEEPAAPRRPARGRRRPRRRRGGHRRSRRPRAAPPGVGRKPGVAALSRHPATLCVLASAVLEGHAVRPAIVAGRGIPAADPRGLRPDRGNHPDTAIRGGTPCVAQARRVEPTARWADYQTLPQS